MLKNPLGAIFKLCDNVINIDVQNIVVNLFFNDEIRKYTLDLNKLDQLFLRGEDSKGEAIGEYSGYTENIYKGFLSTYEGFSKAKTAGENYTLYDTGKFYKSFDVIVYKDGFSIEADTIKDDGTDLARKFGNAILGLDNESKGKLIEKILPEILKEIRFRIAA